AAREDQDVLVLDVEAGGADVGPAQVAGGAALPEALGAARLDPDQLLLEAQVAPGGEPDDVAGDVLELAVGDARADDERGGRAAAQHPPAFAERAPQLAQILVVALAESELAGGAVVLEVPVGRAGDDQVDRAVCQLAHSPGVAADQPGFEH